MKQKWLVVWMVLGIVVLLTGSALLAQANEPVITRENAPDAANVTLEEVVSGLTYPLYLTHAGDGSERLFVIGQAGQVYLVKDGILQDGLFADFSDLASQSVLRGYSEQGLLGLAFHPNYAENGLFYVNYTDRGGNTVVARYSVSPDNPDVADHDSAVVLLTQEQPYPNHNGGHMAFGPDGYLYISLGDGGAANDPLQTGQNPSDWLGSILRIDVDNGDPYGIPEDNPVAFDSRFAPEVWSYGLRNVWRFSFDRATGDMYLADVGQNMWEEVNFEPADSPGGVNYGWNSYEASQPFATSAVPEGMVYPFAEYPHREGDCSVTGGYVYRGKTVPELAGVYLFGDYCTGRIWASYRDTAGEWQTNIFMNSQRQVSSFGEDEEGELYVLDYRGSVLRFTAVE
jgi:glucose/arabinose dehydrogenase